VELTQPAMETDRIESGEIDEEGPAPADGEETKIRQNFNFRAYKSTNML
jgi:hypothetical protein